MFDSRRAASFRTTRNGRGPTAPNANRISPDRLARQPRSRSQDRPHAGVSASRRRRPTRRAAKEDRWRRQVRHCRAQSAPARSETRPVVPREFREVQPSSLARRTREERARCRLPAMHCTGCRQGSRDCESEPSRPSARHRPAQENAGGSAVLNDIRHHGPCADARAAPVVRRHRREAPRLVSHRR